MTKVHYTRQIARICVLIPIGASIFGVFSAYFGLSSAGYVVLIAYTVGFFIGVVASVLENIVVPTKSSIAILIAYVIEALFLPTLWLPVLQ